METKLSLRKCVWKIDESRHSKISLKTAACLVRGIPKFSTILQEKGRGGRGGRRI